MSRRSLFPLLAVLAVSGCGGSSSNSGFPTIQAARTYTLTAFAPKGPVTAGKPVRVSFVIRKPDGTPLTDLASYRIYLGTSAPACPGTPFRTVTASTTTPPAGQTASTVVTGLTAGTTYFARITAVDAAGNESTCTPVTSAVARGDFNVTPTTATSFGTSR